ncbi:hypothetical protein [uncultured Gordonia sp.]|jgi:hypothetical protein|uniref:hypothetical protein n=1 Tax=uncultured Gordonia sp. TaxID=198437 RepID=UPI002601F422|nr:hypothetical protein [uncultured Gordonia sp.]
MGNPDKCLAYPRRIVETQEEPETWHDSWWVHVLVKLLLGFIYIYFAVMVVALIAVVFGGILVSAIVLAAKF